MHVNVYVKVTVRTAGGVVGLAWYPIDIAPYLGRGELRIHSIIIQTVVIRLPARWLDSSRDKRAVLSIRRAHSSKAPRCAAALGRADGSRLLDTSGACGREAKMDRTDINQGRAHLRRACA